MKWNELLQISETENKECEYIRLDGSAIDNESSMFSNEYDCATSLKKEGDNVIVVWTNNQSGSVSYSNINTLTDEMVSDILESIC